MFPDPLDGSAFDRYVAEHPADALDVAALEQELSHWVGVMRGFLASDAEAAGRPQTKRRRRLLSASGLTLAFLGVPLAFATWVLSLPVALAGAALTVYSEWKAFVERQKDEGKRDAGLRIIDRMTQLTTERVARSARSN